MPQSYSSHKASSRSEEVFTVQYETGKHAIKYPAPVDRTGTTTLESIGEAVLVEPALDTGIGNSLLAFSQSNGFIFIAGQNITIAELTAIAESLQCDDC